MTLMANHRDFLDCPLLAKMGMKGLRKYYKRTKLVEKSRPSKSLRL
jgi:hypothetical protein